MEPPWMGQRRSWIVLHLDTAHLDSTTWSHCHIKVPHRVTVCVDSMHLATPGCQWTLATPRSPPDLRCMSGELGH